MKGRYIPMIQREAVFASMMLPEDERNELRARHAIATEVLNRFELHHIAYFSQGGGNLWWNLHPMPKAEHRERTRADIATIAKNKRIVKKQAAHALRVSDTRTSLDVEPWEGGAPSLADLGIKSATASFVPLGKKIPSRPFPKRPKRKK